MFARPTRKLSLFLVFTIILAQFAAFGALDPVYADTNSDTANHWAKNRIEKFVDEGILSGYPDGTFKPDASMTRAEFASVVNRTFGFSQTEGAGAYSDVSESDWYYGHAMKASAAGFMSGYPDGTFRPENRISRQEVAAVLVKLLQMKQSQNQTRIEDCGDFPAMADWSRGYIETVMNKGFMGGYPDGTFGPLRDITRAEAVTLLDNVSGTMYRQDGTFGPETGTETIEGNALITSGGVTLKNLLIKGDLIIGAGVGGGEVTLEGVTVEGTTYVQGGGENSIVLSNTTLGDLIIYKVGGKVRILAKGETLVGMTSVITGGKLEEDGLTGQGFGEIEVITLASGQTLELEGDFEEVSIETEVEMAVTGDTTIGTVIVAPTAPETKVAMDEGSSIGTFKVDAATEITGEGTIETAEVNVVGVTMEQEPEEIILGQDLETEVIGGVTVVQETTTTYSGGGGGGSSTPATPTASSPEASLASGSVAYGSEITLASNTEGAAIYYTTDGSLPSSSNGTEYTSPLKITEDTTLKAVAAKSGYNTSSVSTYEYVVASYLGFTYSYETTTDGHSADAGTRQIERFSIDSAATTNGSVTLTMTCGAMVTSGSATIADYENTTAAQIASTLASSISSHPDMTGWSVSADGAILVFTKETIEANETVTFTFADGATGVQTSLGESTEGSAPTEGEYQVVKLTIVGDEGNNGKATNTGNLQVSLNDGISVQSAKTQAIENVTPDTGVVLSYLNSFNSIERWSVSYIGTEPKTLTFTRDTKAENISPEIVLEVTAVKAAADQVDSILAADTFVKMNEAVQINPVPEGYKARFSDDAYIWGSDEVLAGAAELTPTNREGVYYLYLIADDTGMSELRTRGSYTVTVDDTAPTGTVSYSSESLINGNVTATLATTDVSDVDITNNNGSETYTFTTNGSFTFTFADAAGNTGSVEASVDWIDKVAPAAPVIGTDPSSLTNGSVSVSLSGIEAGASAYVSTDGVNFSLYEGGFDVSANDTTVTAYQTDAAGNDSQNSSLLIDWIDKTAPAAPVIAANPSSITNGSVSVSLSGIEAGATAYVSTDGVNFSLYEGAFDVDANDTTVTAYQTDAAGNDSENSSLLIDWIDKTDPAAPSIDTQAQTVNAASITIEGTAEEGSTVKITGGSADATGAADETTGAFSVSVSLTQNAVNSLSVTATDAAGNESAAATVSVTEDSAGPVITLTGGNVTVGIGSVWSDPGYSATDTVDGDLTENVSLGGDAVDTSTSGQYTITYDVADGVGNDAAQKSRTVTVEDMSGMSLSSESGTFYPYDERDISITGAKNGAGEFLSGEISIQMTSDKQAVAVSENPQTVTFDSSGNGTASLTLTAEGTQTITVAVDGVSDSETVSAFVTTPVLSEGGTTVDGTTQTDNFSIIANQTGGNENAYYIYAKVDGESVLDTVGFVMKSGGVSSVTLPIDFSKLSGGDNVITVSGHYSMFESIVTTSFDVTVTADKSFMDLTVPETALPDEAFTLYIDSAVDDMGDSLSGTLAVTVESDNTDEGTSGVLYDGTLAFTDGSASTELTLTQPGAQTLYVTVEGITDSEDIGIAVLGEAPVGTIADAVAGDDFIGAVYTRVDGNVYYNEYSNSIWGTEALVGPGNDPRLDIDALGNPHVILNTGLETILYSTASTDRIFSPLVLVASGEYADIAVYGTTVHILLKEPGDNYHHVNHIQGIDGSFGPPERVYTGEYYSSGTYIYRQGYTDLLIDVDSAGNRHALTNQIYRCGDSYTQAGHIIHKSNLPGMPLGFDLSVTSPVDYGYNSVSSAVKDMKSATDGTVSVTLSRSDGNVYYSEIIPGIVWNGDVLIGQGSNPTIALDNEDDPIVVYKSAGGELAYALKAGESFQTETVAEAVITAGTPQAVMMGGSPYAVMTSTDGKLAVVEIPAAQAEPVLTSLDIDAWFGSIEVEMTMEDQDGQPMGYTDISASLDKANSTITFSDSEANAEAIVLTFADLESGGNIDGATNLLTFSGDPGLYGEPSGDFGEGGILAAFEPFDHDTVTVSLASSDASWAGTVSATATIPYLELGGVPQENSMNLNLDTNYALDVDGVYTVDLIAAGATGSDFETASGNAVAIGDTTEQGSIEAFFIPIYGPESLMNLTGLTLSISDSDDDGDNHYAVTASKLQAADEVYAEVLIFVRDTDKGALGSLEVVLDSDGGEAGFYIYAPVFIEEVVEDSTTQLTLVYECPMDETSVETLAYYQYMGGSVAIQSVVYDSDNEEAVITLTEEVADGDILLMNAGDDAEGFITSSDGAPLAEYIFERQGGVWIESDMPEGPGASISLYSDSDYSQAASTFEPGDTVYVGIDDASGPSQTGSTVYVQAVSSADGTGISVECTDPDGNNFFYGGFQVSGTDSTTTPANLQVDVENGDTITVTYGMPPEGSNASATVSAVNQPAQAPDGARLDVAFGSLVLDVEPLLGENPLTLDGIGIDTANSKVLIYNWQDEANAIEVTFDQLIADTGGTVDLSGNRITLEGNPSFGTGLFSGPDGLLSGFDFQYHDTVNVSLSGTANGVPYGPIEAVAAIPYLYLVDESETEQGTVTAQINNNYTLSINGTYSDVSISGQSFTPDQTGTAMMTALGAAVVSNQTPVANANGDTGRITAFYLAPVAEGFSMDNVESVKVTLDARPGIIVSAEKVNDANPVSSMLELYIMDSATNSMESISLMLGSMEGDAAVEVMLDSHTGGDMQVDIGSDGTITWPLIDDATEYYVQVYKNGALDPCRTATVTGGNTLAYASELYSEGAGTYAATVTIYGGEMNETIIGSGETYTVQKQPTVTGVSFTGTTLHWDNLSFNNGVTITLYNGETEEDLSVIGDTISTLNDGESGYDLSTYITESKYYGATVTADGQGFTLISSDESGMAVYNNDTTAPTAGDPAIETSDVDLSGIYDSGDTITLSFSESIDFTNFTDITDFALSAGTWGNTTISNASKDGESDYTSSIVITLQDEASIEGLATITIAAAKVVDARDNAAESNLVYTLPELDQPTNPGPALTVLSSAYDTDADNVISITYPVADFSDYHTSIYQIHVDNSDDSYVGMIPEADWSALEGGGQINIVFSETNPLRTAGTYKIRIKATGYDENVTSTFTVAAGTATQLAFKSGSQPVNPTENSGILAEIVVEALDRYGNKCTDLSSGTVSADKKTGYLSDDYWNLSGTTTADFSGGEASFSGIHVESINSQTGYINFTSGSMTPVFGSVAIPSPTNAASELGTSPIFGDTAGFANGVVVTLGTPTVEGNTFKYIGMSTYISVPSGYDTSAPTGTGDEVWIDIVSGGTIDQEVSGNRIGIAEVDASGQVVRFSQSNTLGSIYGQVTGTTDKSGITVTVKKYYGQEQSGSTVTDTTDADGYYAVRGLDMWMPDGASFTIEFTKNGYYDPESPRTLTSLDFTGSKCSLNPTIFGPDEIFNVIRGRAVHSSDTASGVAGLRVMIGFHSGFTPETQAGLDRPFIAETDVNGYFEFYNVIKDPDEYTPIKFYYEPAPISQPGIFTLANGSSNQDIYDTEIVTVYDNANPDNNNLDWNDAENIWEFRESAHFIVDDSHYSIF